VPILRTESDLELRTARRTDVRQLSRWLTDPRVLAFYGGRDRPLTPTAVVRHYFRRRRDPATGRFYEYQACIVERSGKPVGFVQYYRLTKGEARLVGPSGSARTYGIDLFLGDPALWGTGLGPSVIELTRDYLREARAATRVIADPRADNVRSVRAFRKAGFRQVRLLPQRELHEGVLHDCWLMEYP